MGLMPSGFSVDDQETETSVDTRQATLDAKAISFTDLASQREHEHGALKGKRIDIEPAALPIPNVK